MDLTVLEAIGKEVIPVQAQSQINFANVLESLLQKNRRDIEIAPTSFARVPILVDENPAIGAVPFDGVLPDPGHAGYRNAKVRLGSNYGVIEVNNQWLYSTNATAVVKPYLASQMEALMPGLKKDRNRQFWGDGRGILATVTVADAGPTNTITVGSVRDIFIRRRIDIIEIVAGTVIASARNVTAIDTALNTITFDGAGIAVTIAPAVGVYNQGSRNAEIIGLAALVSATNPALGNYHDVDATTVPLWRSTIETTGGAMDQTKIQNLETAMYEANGMDNDPYLCITTPTLRQKLAQSLQGQVRYVNLPALRGGFNLLEWNGNAVARDRMCPTGEFYMLNPKFIQIYEETDWETQERSGSRFIPTPDRRDKSEVRLFKYDQIGCHRRNAHGKATGLV